MAKKKTPQADNIQELESVLTKTEKFIEDNQKVITYIIGAIVVAVVGFLALQKFYLQPRETEAQSQMFMAEQYFEKDSFNLALNGDGNYLGFLDIMDDYGLTRTARVAKYYTGISYLRLGQFEEALDYLNKFKTKDLLLGPIAEGAKGDAYLELGEHDKALDHYMKAVQMNENELTTPVYLFKAGTVLESQDELERALELYRQIKTKYPNSAEGSTIDKYITRVEIKLGS